LEPYKSSDDLSILSSTAMRKRLDQSVPVDRAEVEFGDRGMLAERVRLGFPVVDGAVRFAAVPAGRLFRHTPKR